jgi:hypothetical protein
MSSLDFHFVVHFMFILHSNGEAILIGESYATVDLNCPFIKRGHCTLPAMWRSDGYQARGARSERPAQSTAHV